MPDPGPLLLSTERAAERLELGRSKVCELIASGELESVRIGRARRIPADALVSYVERLRAEQRASDPTDADAGTA
jgi:excisionase family DNA binding protein